MNTATTEARNNLTFSHLMILGGLIAVIIYLSIFTVSTFIPAKANSHNWEELDLTIQDFLIRSEIPPIALTSEQEEEIKTFYNDGIEFNNPNDPCQKLKLLV